MSRITYYILLFITGALLFTAAGCMMPIDEQLSLAEKKLDEALAVGASDIAKEEYRKAQDQFDQAMEAMRNDNPSEARAFAKKAILYAEDGINKVKKHENMLNSEEEQRGN